MSKLILNAEPGKQEITATRMFNAPPELVFKACIDPQLIPHWWGPAYLTTTVEKMEVRMGGIWRFVQQDPQGVIHAFHGVYHAVIPPRQIVYTFEYEGVPGHVLLETLTFEAHNDATRLVDHLVFQSVEDRDGMMTAGMEEGSVESMDRLEKLLVKMSSRV